MIPSGIDITGRTTYSYDYVNSPETVVNPAGKSLAYEFYSNGLRKHLTDPDSRVTIYTYDADSQPKTLTSPHSEVTTFIYDDAGRRVETQLDNGTKNETGHDSADRANFAKTTNSAGSVLSA